MIAHGAPYASGACPPVPIGERIGENSEGIGDTLAAISERLAVVAVSAHIMERRHPRDCYARSIARESRALAVELRELTRQAQAGAPMRAPRIVDAASSTDTAPDTAPDTTPDAPEDAPTDTAPDGEHDAREHVGELCSFPGCCHWYNDPCADCLEVERGATSRGSSRRSTTQKRRQTPPDARHAAPAGGSSERPPATPKPSLASSGARGGAPRRAGGAQ